MCVIRAEALPSARMRRRFPCVLNVFERDQTILDPSGDHEGVQSTWDELVRFTSPVPSAFTMQTSA